MIFSSRTYTHKHTQSPRSLFLQPLTFQRVHRPRLRPLTSYAAVISVPPLFFGFRHLPNAHMRCVFFIIGSSLCDRGIKVNRLAPALFPYGIPSVGRENLRLAPFGNNHFFFTFFLQSWFDSRVNTSNFVVIMALLFRVFSSSFRDLCFP